MHCAGRTLFHGGICPKLDTGKGRTPFGSKDSSNSRELHNGGKPCKSFRNYRTWVSDYIPADAGESRGFSERNSRAGSWRVRLPLPRRRRRRELLHLRLPPRGSLPPPRRAAAARRCRVAVLGAAVAGRQTDAREARVQGPCPSPGLQRVCAPPTARVAALSMAKTIPGEMARSLQAIAHSAYRAGRLRVRIRPLGHAERQASGPRQGAGDGL
jgi:hypothetical protein